MTTNTTLHTLQKLKDSLLFYAEKCLHIRTKEGAIVPFIPNRVQVYLHTCLERQRQKTGRVRAVILKGRQQGCSTYIGARFFHKVAYSKGCQAFIMAHDTQATHNLFAMTKRFYTNCPTALRPQSGRNNLHELAFSRLDSGYRVGTAGSRGVGRSMTVQLFHGSEVAYWRSAREHAAGVLQTVPEGSGSEVIFESTACGMNNFFHASWQAAQNHESGYQAIFIPWFWQPEYCLKISGPMTLTDKEKELQRLFQLTPGQLAWRRKKIFQLGDETLFQQEYPCTADEAFQITGQESFIRPIDVIRARKAREQGNGPVVAGVDPARFGDDRTALIFRQGRRAFGLKTWQGKDTMEVAGICRNILEESAPKVDRIFIDAGGLGAGVVDRLREMGFSARVTAVQFGERASRPKRYQNKRCEMWAEMRQWLTDSLQADIPDDDSLQADMTAPSYSYDSMGRLKLESKEDMKKRGLSSPDKGDALALTFACPVRTRLNLQKYADSGKSMFHTTVKSQERQLS